MQKVAEPSETAVLYYYQLCPCGLFTPLSRELYQQFLICDGLKRVTPSEYEQLSAIYVDACGAIEPHRQNFEQAMQEKMRHGTAR